MLDSVFLTINQWMTGGIALAALGCFAWGIISVLFSPCHLASIPLIVGYVGGQEKMVQPRQAGIYSILFTLGLFITIALIGIACALLGRMLGDVGNYWQILIGFILIWVIMETQGACHAYLQMIMTLVGMVWYLALAIIRPPTKTPSKFERIRGGQGSMMPIH